MNKVITINLNNHAYQVEEKGYEALTHYLHSARAALADNPDCDEIMLDFEQAIADKCDATLDERKNIVTTKEVEEIIEAMGPVEGVQNKTEKTAETSAASEADRRESPKRLYRLRSGEWFFGVCSGLAAYFNIDITLMRLIFVALAVLTHGAWIAVYAILIFVMPVALTEDDIAAARGEPPLTARDILNRARDEYHNDIKKRFGEWRVAWKERKKWEKRWHDEEVRAKHKRHNHHRDRRAEWAYRPNTSLAIFGSIMLSALTVAWIFSIWTFLAYGTIFGYAIVTGKSIWVTLVSITVAYLLISWPFKAIMHGWGGGPFTFVWSIVAIGFAFYLASLIFPDVAAWWHAMTAYLSTIR